MEENCKEVYFVERINKEQKNLLKAYEDLRKIDKEATLLIINPDTYFGYDIKTGHAVALEFKDLSNREY